MTITSILLLPPLSAAFILLWWLRWRDYAFCAAVCRRTARVASREAGAPVEKTWAERVQGFTPRLSLVVTCCDQGEALRRNLPAMLEQRFEDYEVIVVDAASTDDTADVLKYYAARHPHLRHTFISPSARYVSRSKLAVTLGVRAARAPWVVVTRADCTPSSDRWLATLYAFFNDRTDFVLGYANYADDGSAVARRAVCERLRSQCVAARMAMGLGAFTSRCAPRGKAAWADACNMALRKQAFMVGQGYAGSLTLPLGEDIHLVAALARPGRTEVAFLPDASVLQELPDARELSARRLRRAAVLRHAGRRTLRFRLREGLATLALFVFVGSAVAYAALSAEEIRVAGIYAAQRLWCDVPVAMMALGAVLLPFCSLRVAVRRLGERRFSLPYMMHYALRGPFVRGMVRLRRWRNRRDFVRR